MRLWLKQNIIKTKWSSWLSVLLFGYFIILIPSDLVSYGWSTDLVRIGHVGGNYSAIQFGLLLRVINIFTNLLPFSVIKNSYVLASFLGAMALGTFYKILSTIEDFLKIGDKRLGFLLKNLTVILLATSQSFLLQSLFIERYMLVVLGLEIVVLILFRKQKLRDKFDKKHILLTSVLILGISYHWLFLWALLLILISQIGNRVGLVKNLVSFVIRLLLIVLGGIIVGYLLTFNNSVSHAFEGANNISDSFKMYSKTYLSDGFSHNFRINSRQIINTFSKLISGLKSVYGVFVAFFGLIGIRILMEKFRKQSKWGLIFLIGIFLWPSIWFSDIKMISEISELYLLVIVVILSLLSWIGIMFVSNRLLKGLSIIHGQVTSYVFFSLMVGGLMMMSLIVKTNNLEFLNFEASQMKEIVNQLPEKSLILCFDDVLCADLIYLSEIEKVGSEIEVVPYYFHPQKYRLNLSEYRLFEYEEYPYILHEIVSLALANDTRIFSVGLSDDYYRFLGFDLGFVHYLPLGNYGEILLTTPNDWPIVKGLDNDTDGLNKNTLLENKFINLLIRNRILNSQIYFLSGKYEDGYIEMNTTSKIANRLSDKDFSMFLASRNNAEQHIRNQLFVESSKNDSIDKIFKEIPLYIESGYYGRAADLVRGAIMLNPLEKDIRLKAVDVYKQIGLSEIGEFEMGVYNQLLN